MSCQAALLCYNKKTPAIHGCPAVNVRPRARRTLGYDPIIVYLHLSIQDLDTRCTSTMFPSATRPGCGYLCALVWNQPSRPPGCDTRRPLYNGGGGSGLFTTSSLNSTTLKPPKPPYQNLSKNLSCFCRQLLSV